MTPRKARKRNARREGAPWKRSDGRWVARVWPPKGSVYTGPRYVYGRDRDEVITKRKALEHRLSAGADADAADTTVGAYLEAWLDDTLGQYVRSGRMAPSTRDSYRDNARMHILPYLGHIRMLDLSAPAVRQWQDVLVTKRSSRTPKKVAPGKRQPKPPLLSARTVAYCRSILHKAIADAIRDEVIPGLERNVVDKVDPAKDRMYLPPAIIKPEEAAALLLAASQDPLWCYWLAAFGTGFRRSEGLGMRWQDLDLETRVWRPAYAVQWVRSEPGRNGNRKGTLQLVPLKARSASQPVALPSSVCEALGRWRAEQLGIRAKAVRWAQLDLVFSTGVGTALSPRNVDRAWERVCQRAGVRKVRLHDLRHACASYLLAAGVDVKVVQGTLRHSRLATTMIYLHALEDIPTAGAEAMDSILANLAATAKTPVSSAHAVSHAVNAAVEGRLVVGSE